MSRPRPCWNRYDQELADHRARRGSNGSLAPGGLPTGADQQALRPHRARPRLASAATEIKPAPRNLLSAPRASQNVAVCRIMRCI
jgi:hypothetical protein